MALIWRFYGEPHMRREMPAFTCEDKLGPP